VKKEIDPRMHSAEHILTQTMGRLFGCGRPVTTHIEKKKSKCDYPFDRPLADAEIEELERRVNRVIEADLPVSVEWMSVEEAEKRYDLGRLPEEVNGRVRIVKIGDYDACPCIGPHVESTGEVGRFRITSSSFDGGWLRVRFRLC